MKRIGIFVISIILIHFMIFYIYADTNITGVNNTINNSINNTSNESPKEPKIFLKLDWDDLEIVNGKEFNIEVDAFNLKDLSYDLKVYIKEDIDGKTISQTKDEDFKWISSERYVKEFFRGPGNSSDSIKLRINENFKDLSGSATIIARIRETGKSSFIEKQEDIFISKNKIPTNPSIKNNNEYLSNEYLENSQINKDNNYPTQYTITGGVIRLGKNSETESIKTQNNIVYESKNELIKKYLIYGFIILIIIFLILLVLRLI